jgi:hypothetical protein
MGVILRSDNRRKKEKEDTVVLARERPPFRA